jgi:DNA-binding MarR family transcriptional regulator
LLANAFGILRPAVSRKLNVLFKKNKIVKKHNDPSDQRKVHLVLTAEGKSDLAAMDLGYLQWFSEDFMADQGVDLGLLQEQTNHVLDRIPGR